ncbi:hypothetical protein DVH05_001732 [Phytophthora capsici]|nr:hypothetical protein DVH05_001732 [Phytophthora capsici]
MLRQLPLPPSPPSQDSSPEHPSSSDLAMSGELPPSAVSPSLDIEAPPVAEIQLAQNTDEIEIASSPETAPVDASEESDEPDDSDEDWSDANASSAEDEVLTGESELEEILVSIWRILISIRVL